METKKTSLFYLHQKNGAKFVQFAGYQMPIQYKGGIIELNINIQDLNLEYLMFLIWANYLLKVSRFNERI